MQDQILRRWRSSGGRPRSNILSSTDSVKIILNGKPARIKPGLTVSDLLIQRRMRAELVTVELDGTILQKLDYDTTQIKEGDKVEFVFYMGGGDLKS